MLKPKRRDRERMSVVAQTADPGIAQAAEDIRAMRVRGAAKIGRHAAQALGEFAARWDGEPPSLQAAAAALVAARPTAVSLPNAVDFVVRHALQAAGGLEARRDALAGAARDFETRAEQALKAIGANGATLVPEGGTVLTICNSQGAITPLLAAHEAGKRFQVIALETRPWRQGLLTVKQLHEAGIRAALAVDAAAFTMLREADLVMTGADAIARNGDVVNKVGTGALAVLARERGVPVHVCAETFKLDRKAPTGAQVVIEEREAAEIVAPGEIPEGVQVRNPVFDVTDHRLVKSYVTDLGVLKAHQILDAARKAWDWE
ncbi:MAG: ribose 1,5-bisphosphate isomerase [Thermoplasmata archaeon]|jgi:ribose 1,5-bisphosphate isomerase|nr:ribose 1,5-bisphosphate isomerase [Thermoplasmata archaeon]